jgi:hypothetical protein
MENAKLLLANTSMDTDKIKIFGSRVRVDSMQKVRLQMNLTALLILSLRPTEQQTLRPCPLVMPSSFPCPCPTLHLL